MSTAPGGPSSLDGPPHSPTPAATPTAASDPGAPSAPGATAAVATGRREVPVRADGIQLIGEAKGSGYRDAPSLVRRADGQTIQLTRLLFLVLKAVDGVRGIDEIAELTS